MKNTLVPKEEQPYKIPSNWCWIRLENIAEWGSGGTPSRKRKEYYNGNIPWIKTGELNNGYIFNSEEKITELGLKNSSAKLYPINTVIIAMYGATIGKVGILSIEATTNQACACAIVYKNILFKYVFHYLIYQKEAFINKSKGGAQPNLSQEIIKKHEIPLPPIKEQQRIVNRIESLFAKIDRAKELIENTLAQFEQNKMAILHKAFTGELTAKWRKEKGLSKDTWKRKKISEVCTVVRGGSPRPAGSPQFYGGNIPFMKVADITNNDTPYINSTASFIKEAGLYKTRMVEANTLLLTNSGATLGVPAICTFKTTFNDGIAAFLNLNPKSVKYYYYFFISKTAELRGINKGAAQPNLNTKIIGEIMHNVPTIEEQQEIVNILDKLLAKYNKIKNLEQQLEKIELLKKAILAKAFRGELGTNNPDEESAENLLKEILAEK